MFMIATKILFILLFATGCSSIESNDSALKDAAKTTDNLSISIENSSSETEDEESAYVKSILLDCPDSEEIINFDESGESKEVFLSLADCEVYFTSDIVPS
jgi:hypothetical protein